MEVVGERRDSGAGGVGAVPGDDDRAPGGGDGVDGRCDGVGVGAASVGGCATGRPDGRLRRGLNLDFVGQDQVCDAPSVDGVFDRRGDQFGVIGVGFDRNRRHRDVAEHCGEVHVLEGALPRIFVGT